MTKGFQITTTMPLRYQLADLLAEAKAEGLSDSLLLSLQSEDQALGQLWNDAEFEGGKVLVRRLVREINLNGVSAHRGQELRLRSKTYLWFQTGPIPIVEGTVIHGTGQLGDVLVALLDRAWDLMDWMTEAQWHRMCGLGCALGDKDVPVEGEVIEVMDLLNELSPEGLEFKTHEGDSSDYGWWRVVDGN